MQQYQNEVLKLKKETALPHGIEEKLEKAVDSMVEIEKEGYHNDLIPFSQYEASLRMKAKEFIQELINQYERAVTLLKEDLEKEEKIKEFPPEARFSRWEEVFFEFNKKIDDPNFQAEFSKSTLQELTGIEWQLMDRAYDLAKELAKEKRFDDASAIFACLRALNPEVLEYWFGEAACLFELSRFEEAMDLYCQSLELQPQNPTIFFQIANCLYQLKENARALEALNLSIKYAEGDPSYKDLLTTVLAMKQDLESK